MEMMGSPVGPVMPDLVNNYSNCTSLHKVSSMFHDKYIGRGCNIIKRQPVKARRGNFYYPSWGPTWALFSSASTGFSCSPIPPSGLTSLSGSKTTSTISLPTSLSGSTTSPTI